MLKHTALVLALVAAVPLGAAAPISQEDRDALIKDLERSRLIFLEAIDDVSTEAQWNFKQAPNRWSVAECAEHIAATEDALMGMVKEKVMASGPRKDAASVKEIDEFVLTAISDRTKKAQAAEPLQPTKRFGSPAETAICTPSTVAMTAWTAPGVREIMPASSEFRVLAEVAGRPVPTVMTVWPRPAGRAARG